MIRTLTIVHHDDTTSNVAISCDRQEQIDSAIEVAQVNNNLIFNDDYYM